MKILVSGCSYSHTCGFNEPAGKIWVDHISKQHEVKNIAQNGHSNFKIFIRTCSELLVNNSYDLIIVQWSSLYRLNLNKGHNIYNNLVSYTLADKKNLAPMHRVWKKQFIHPRIELLEFLTLVATMTRFLKSLNLQFVFVKAFDNELTNLSNQYWKQCDPSFKDFMLHLSSLPDWEVDLFFNDLRNHYLAMTSLSQDYWINLNKNDWFSDIIDTADDELHPGILSNRKYFEQIKDFVTKFAICL